MEVVGGTKSLGNKKNNILNRKKVSPSLTAC